MEKTKGILVKMLFNMHKDNFSKCHPEELFTTQELKDSICELLDEDKLLIFDLAIFIEEVNKRCQDQDNTTKEDMKLLRGLWESFDIDSLIRVRDFSVDSSIKDIVTKMVILKKAHRKFDEDLMRLDLESYFIPNDKLIEMVLV